MKRRLRREWKASEDAAFTVVELMITLMISGILMGITAFALTQYFRAQALTSASRELLTDLRDVQVRAQAEVVLYRVIFCPDTTSPLECSSVVNGEPPIGAEAYRIQRLIGPSDYETVETTKLDTGVEFHSALFNPTGTCGEANSRIIYFCPRGVSSEGSLVLRSLRLNQDRIITVRGLTSRAEVS